MILDGGRFLFQPGRNASRLKQKGAKEIFKAYKKMGYYLAGIGGDDLAAGCSFLKKLDPEGSLLVSANLYCEQKPAFSPFRIFDVRGVRVGVAGLSGGRIPHAAPSADKTEIKAPDQAVETYMAKIKKNADIMVVLSSLTPIREMEFLKRHPEVVLLISSGRTSPTYSPAKQGKCLVVSTHPQGKSVGVIKLFLKKEAENYSIDHYKNSLIMLKKGSGAVSVLSRGE